MPESQLHIDLVKVIIKWIHREFNENINQIAIYVDLPDFHSSCKPRIIDGFKPDVFATVIKTKEIILGEAKTAFDLDSVHSEKQISRFLQFCAKEKSTVFIFSVPWELKIYAKNYIKALKNELGINTLNFIVLDNLYQ